MLKEPVVRLRWQGKKTISEALRALREGDDIVVELPLAVHHALAVRLRPSTPAQESEPLQTQGGAELVEAAADIAGLEILRELASALRRGHWQVTVASPYPRIIIRHR